MTRPQQNDDGQSPRDQAKSIVIDFSSAPSQFQWEESTPSREVETKSTDKAFPVGLVVIAEKKEKLPDRIGGRYDVLEELGTGGQATVYLAQDTILRRKVAIKISKPNRPISPAKQEQFKREAQAIASVRHPGIVEVYDYGINDDGRCYIVLEYLPGQSLKDSLKNPETRKTFTVERTLQFIIKVAEALSFAHQRGIYHCDLKPGNILLDEHGNPHISDFGLAVTQESQQGLKGQVAGTAAYMSPEQVRGETDWLNGQADIWALGLTAYEMIAGRRPFQGTEDEVYDQILHRTPTSLRQQNPQLLKSVDELVMKCLEKEPARRYATTGDLVAGLMNCLDRPTATASVAVIPRFSFPLKIVFLVLAALAASVFLGLLFRGYFFAADGDGHPSGNGSQTVSVDARPGEWRFFLDQMPELILWPFPDGRSNDWQFIADKKKVFLSSDKRHLLRLGKTQYQDYDLSVTMKQAQRGGKMGLFLGCHESAGEKPRRMQYETLTVEWNGAGNDKPMSVDYSLHLDTPDAPGPLRHIPNVLDAKGISPPGFQAITIVVSVRHHLVDKIVVLGSDQKALIEFQPNRPPLVPTVQGSPAVPQATGDFGLFADESHDGISGEFLSFGFRYHN